MANDSEDSSGHGQDGLENGNPEKPEAKRQVAATRQLRRVPTPMKQFATQGAVTQGTVTQGTGTREEATQDESVQILAAAVLKAKTPGAATPARAVLGNGAALGIGSIGGGSFRSSTLAPVQRQTLEFLRNFIAEKGYAPTLKDIASHIGVKSLSTAHFHLERLVDKGFIRRGDDGMVELVDVAKPELGPTAVPLVGVIAAGMPIEAIEQTTFIDIPPSMIDGRGEVFCLEVSGTSMIDAHICDQDIVVIKKQTSAENGQIVVALLEDGSATLKTFRRLKNGKVMLIPANPTLTPITLDHVSIQGRVIGVIRQLH